MLAELRHTGGGTQVSAQRYRCRGSKQRKYRMKFRLDEKDGYDSYFQTFNLSMMYTTSHSDVRTIL